MPYFLPTEASEAHDIIEEVFADSVVGIYLFGSAVVGGLQTNSDVDVLVALNRRTTFNERKKLVNLLMTVSGEIGNTSSIRPIELTVVSIPAVVPWHFPPFAEFVYGEWLREGFKSGIVPEPSSDPDLAILLKKVIDSSIVLAGREASEVFEPIGKEDIQKAIRQSLPNLLAGIKGDERNVLLTLARMWFTASNGQITSVEVCLGNKP